MPAAICEDGPREDDGEEEEEEEVEKNKEGRSEALSFRVITRYIRSCGM